MEHNDPRININERLHLLSVSNDIWLTLSDPTSSKQWIPKLTHAHMCAHTQTPIKEKYT